MMYIAGCLIALILTWGAAAIADNPSSSLYDHDTLEYWKTRYAHSTQRILTEGIFPELESDEYQVLNGVRLKLPLRSDDLIGFTPRIRLQKLSSRRCRSNFSTIFASAMPGSGQTTTRRRPSRSTSQWSATNRKRASRRGAIRCR